MSASFLRSLRQRWHFLSLGTKLLFAAITTGTLFRFLMGIWQNPLDYLFSDPNRHWMNAQRLFCPELMNGCDPIFYQVYLFGVQKLTNGNHLAIGITTGVLSAMMPWVYYRAARAFPETRDRALIVWAMMLATPSFFVIYRYFMIETVLLPLIGLGLWMTGRHLRKCNLASFIVVVVVWMAAAFTKPAAFIIAAICTVFAWRYGLRRIWGVVVAVGLVTVMLIPNAIRTHQILGYCAPFGSGWIAQIMHAGGTKHTRFHWNRGEWIYSSPSCYIQPLYPLNHWAIKRAFDDTIREVTVRKNDGQQGWERACQHAQVDRSQRFVQWGENIILFLFAPSWPDSGADSWAGTVNYWSRWMWGPLIFYVLFGNWEIFKTRRFPLIPLATTSLLLLLMFQNSVTMEGRYRKPVEPLILFNLVWLLSPGCNRIRGWSEDDAVEIWKKAASKGRKEIDLTQAVP